MDEETFKHWAVKPDACRCCLSGTGTWDLTTGYIISTDGVKEVFSDLLFDCFGINLSLLHEWGSSHVICGLCLGRLRDASGFMKQVKRCEAFYTEYYKKTGITQVKEEVESFEGKVGMKDKVSEDDNKERIKTEEISVEPIITHTSTRSKTKIKKQDKKSKRKKIKRRSKANLSKFCKVIVDGNEPKDIEESSVDSSSPVIPEGVATHLRNTRLRQNMTIMLKNSTIIPFRYLVNTNNQYTCQYCEDKHFVFEDLRKHVHEKHSAIAEDEIIKHLKYPVDFVKAEISDIHCKVCDAKFQSLELLAEHLSEDHKKMLQSVDFKPFHGVLGFVLDREKPLCQICFKEFNNLRGLITHTSEHCGNFSCGLCSRKFFSKRMLAVHAMKHKQKSYKCKFCEKTFEVIGSRTYHMKKEHNHGMHKCSECGESFIQFDQRMCHLLKVHNIRKPTVHFCELCSKEYANSSTLKKHMQYTHWNDKRHVCDLCGKSFTFKNCLTKHLRVHSGEKPFECKICNKRFGQSNTLRVHLRGHTNDKRYVCEICGTAFIQKHCLKRHNSTHHPGSSRSTSD